MPVEGARKRVYVSSTFVDLKEHRAALKAALEQAGFDVDSMERYPAFDERPLDYCLNDVAGCDAYVLLLAHRYGYRPEVAGQRTLSITEREYRHAQEQGKPCFVFCVDGEHNWNPKHIDSPKSQDGRALATFQKRVADAHGLRTFTDPDNLAHQVLAALSAHTWADTGQPLASAPAATPYHWPAAWDFGPYMAQKREGFEGREWLFRDIAVWLTDSRSRALLVQADFGVGKSAFMAELVQRNPGGCIAAFHFCQHDTQDTLHPGYFVRSVAAQLAAGMPAYKALVKTDATLQERLNRALEDPGSAFEGSVLAPLAKLAAPGGPRLLLVDALDESLELDAETARRSRGIVDLLGARAGRFPPWLKVLATTGSNPDVLRRLDGFAPRLIDAESAANVDDLRRYVLHCAARMPLAEQLREAGTTAQALAELLAGKSQGKFLLAVRAVRALEEADASGGSRHMRLDEVAALPPSMDAWYFDAFERRYARAGRDYESTRAVLGVLAAAREPLSIETVAAVLGVEPAAVKAVRQLLPDFLQLRAGRLAFDHFSMAQWLTREDEQGFPRAGCHAVDLPASQAKLRRWALAQIAAGTGHHFPYLLRHLASHLVDDAERCSIYGQLMLTRFEWLQARLDQDGVDALLADAEYIKGLPEHPWLEAVLRNGMHVLRAHPKQLAAQLLGRVGSGVGAERYLGPLMDSVHYYLNDPANRPSTLLPTSRSLRLVTAHVATLEGGTALAVFPDGRLALGGFDGTVRVWDPQRRAEPLLLEGHTGLVSALAVLPDGRLASGAGDRTVRVWDPQRRVEPLLLEGHARGVAALAVLPDGRLASGSYDHTVRVWNLQRRAEPLVFKGHAGEVWALTVLPDGRLASGGDESTVRVWDPQCRAEPLLFEQHAGRVNTLAVLPDGCLASGSDDGTVRVWDPQRRAEPLLFERHAGRVNALAVLPDGRLASGSDDGIVRVWDPQYRAEPLLLEEHAGRVSALVVLLDGRLASGNSDGTVRVWDLQRRAEPLRFEGHARGVTALAVLPDGRLASGAGDRTVRVWDPQRRAEPLLLQRHADKVSTLAALPDGRLASGSHDSTVRVWDPQRRTEPLIFEGHTDWVNALAVLPDGRIASGSDDCSVRVWNSHCRAEPVLLEGHTDWVSALAVLPDGRLASGSDDRTVRVWDPQYRTEPLFLEKHAGRVSALVALPDGRLASGSDDGTVRVWDPQRRAEPLQFGGHTDWVNALAVLPDGRLASGSDDRTVRVWDPQRRTKPLRFEGHAGWVTALAVLPDGRLASGSDDRTVRVWDPQYRAEPLLLEGHAGGVRALAALPDGRLASGASDGTVRVWDLARQASTGTFYADASVSCLAVVLGGLIAAGGGDGTVHFLRQAGG